MKEQLINSIMHYLVGKLPEEHFADVRLHIYYLLADYQLTKNCTDVIIPP